MSNRDADRDEVARDVLEGSRRVLVRATELHRQGYIGDSQLRDAMTITGSVMKCVRNYFQITNARGSN